MSIDGALKTIMYAPSQGWDWHYQLLQQYFHEHGTANVPFRFLTKEKVKLGIWLGNQRAAHRRGKLLPARINKLMLLQGALNPDYAPSKGWEWNFAVLQQ